MRMSTILITMLIAHSVCAQAVNTKVWLAIKAPQATCALVLRQDVNFGVVKGGEQSVSLPPAAFGKSGRIPGWFVVTGQHASGYIISIDFPKHVTGPGTPLAYEGQWAQASTATEPFESVEGAIWHTSAESSFERHFRVGGHIRGLSANTRPGLYSGQISITTTCN